jgi:hypothetical protein
MKKICCLCNKAIKKDDTYFKVELYLLGKKKAVAFAHKKCKDEQMQMPNQLNNLIQGVTNFAINQGIIPEKKEVIQLC